MSNPWTSASDSTRRRALEVVRSLLHDWVKYMEMRLLSIDWSAPPPDVARLLRRAVLETRRQGTAVRGVSEIWAAGRDALLALDAAEAKELVGEIDRDVDALEALPSLDTAAIALQGARIDEIVRRPGVRLRRARDLLTEDDCAG